MPQPRNKPARTTAAADNDVKRAETRRGAGRPQAAGDTVGRDALINATVELLKIKPHDKINRLEIARFAGVDPGLIRYYFGDMQKLFAEVVVKISQNFRSNMTREGSGASPEERLRQRIRRNVELFLEYPHHHALVAEVIFSEENSPARQAWRDVIRNSLGLFETLLQEGEAEGTMRRVEHRFAHLVLIGASEFYANSSALLADMFEPEAGPEEMKESFIDAFTDLILNGIRKR